MKLACLKSGSDKSLRHFNKLAMLHDFVTPAQSDVIVVLGGDVILLHVVHKTPQLGKPNHGMNSGTVGFLLNELSTDHSRERINKAKLVPVSPLRMHVETNEGETHELLAFNEVALWRQSGQSANLAKCMGGGVAVNQLIGDGLIIATPAGSMAYHVSAGGQILPPGSDLLALTPLAAFLPRRWRGAQLPDNLTIDIRTLDPNKRPVAASADGREANHVIYTRVNRERETAARLPFDPSHSFDERIIGEQFRFDEDQSLQSGQCCQKGQVPKQVNRHFDVKVV